jgi:hypothetical protein
MQIIDLVDSIDYATNSNWQPFVTNQFKAFSNIKLVQLADIHTVKPTHVICRLKQRTLFRNIDKVSKWANGVKFVIYDNDPWEAFNDASPYKGAYALFNKVLNVQSFVVASLWWKNWLEERNFKSSFIKMWGAGHIAPPIYLDRKIPVGFVGTVHSYRKELFSKLAQNNVHVDVKSGLPYKDYCDSVKQVQIYVRSDAGTIFVDKQPISLTNGTLFRDIELSSLGCFSIRDKLEAFESYIDNNIKTVFQYETISDIQDIINDIQNMNAIDRQNRIDSTTQYIRSTSDLIWKNTAQHLIDLCT